MSAKEAYDLICSEFGEKFFVAMCRDYGSFFGFIVKPEGTDPKQRTYVGGRLLCANKKNGNVFCRDIAELVRERWAPVYSTFND